MSAAEDNQNRANRALRALEHYKEKELGEAGPVGSEDLSDLLADILHLCVGRDDIDLDSALESARDNFSEEILEAAG